MAQVQDSNIDEPAEENEMNSSEQNGGGSGGVIAPSTFVFGQNMESRVVKRPAEEQLDPETAEKEDEEGEEPGEFPKASSNVMAQRPIIAPGKVSAFKDKPPQADSSMDTENSEADKPAFKLAPPTFATTRPTKTEEKVSKASIPTQLSPAKAVLRPAVLATQQDWQPTFGSAAKASGTPFKLKESALQAATEQVNGKGQNKKDQESKGGSRSDGVVKTDGLSPVEASNGASSSSSKVVNENTDSNLSTHSAEGSGDTPRNNYFIKLNPGDTRDVGFGVFGKFSDSQIGTVSFGKNEKDHDGTTSENYFLQFANNGSDGSSSETASASVATSSTSPEDKSSRTESPSNLNLSGSGSSFVFGQHMNERVTSASKQEGELETAAEYVFGQNVSDRVKSKETKGDSPEKSSSLFTTEVSGKTLAENANAYAEAKESSRLKFEEVPKLTGEEEEENVLQVQCKLYIFDVVKRSWQERGRGSLRLNDKRQSTTESAIQSRLVMRTQGSLRVILNTKLWSSMILEKASSKSLRISALDSDTKTPRVFLISATPKDAEQIYRAIEYRIQELKHEEQTKADTGKDTDALQATTQDEETTQEGTSSKVENKDDGHKNEPLEEPSSAETDEDGALQSTDKTTQEDSEATSKKSEEMMAKETT